MYSLNARYVPTPVELTTATTGVTADAAIQTTEDHLSRRVPIQALSGRVAELLNYDGPTAELKIWTDGTTLHLAWHVEVRPNWRQRWLYFIDAQSGAILQSSNSTPTDGPTTAQGVDLNGSEQTLRVYDFDDEFVLLDASRPMFLASQPNLYWNPQGALWTLTQGFADFGEAELNQVSSLDNGWNDPAAVSAHDNMARVFDYFLQVHGHSGIDGEGSTLISVVHATDGGEDMENAFWNNPFMVYGDGGLDFAPLAGALDVAAHEFTHGVIENTINLDYVMESGALNESFADIFGAMVDREDWFIGEDIGTTHKLTGTIRC